MKKYLALILLVCLSCSKKNDEEEEKNIYATRISILNDFFSKPNQFPIYLYYTDVTITRNNRTLSDSTDNKQIKLKDLSIIVNQKVYDIRKINHMSAVNTYDSNKVWGTQKLEILFGTIYLKMQLKNLTLLTADGVKNRRQGFGFRPLTAVFTPSAVLHF